jgi:thioredoxin reductase
MKFAITANNVATVGAAAHSCRNVHGPEVPEMVEATRTEPDSGRAAVWDVAVVGGGVAGLSGAVALARSRRSVLVIDAGRPRNAAAAHLHNYLSRDGTAPSQLLATGRDEVIGYGGQIVIGTVTSATRPDGDVFRLELDDGSVVQARRLLVTTGLVDELPAVAGVAQRWGRDVLHCPYCHGWEVRDRPIGVLATRPPAVEFALLWRQLSADVTLLCHSAPALDDDQRERLAARGVRVIDGRVAGLEIHDDRLTGVRLDDGQTVRCDALAVQPTFVARAELLSGLGLSTTEQRFGGHAAGAYVAADDTGATEVPGVWVAGNVADLGADLIGSAAAGVRAAAAINADLVADDTARALDRHRAARARTAVLDGDTVESYWDRFYAEPNPAWSGQVNTVLVRETADMASGTALDLGCGEGADAIWLAQQGWTVTAVDIARPALQRARERAVATGVADRIAWLHDDLARWQPTDSFDLVSVHYLHSSVDLPRDRILRAAAAAVAPDGVLLVVGHAGPLPAHADAEPGTKLPTVDEVLAALDLPPTQWRVERAADIAHDAPGAGADDHPHTQTDTVVRIRRLTGQNRHPPGADIV